MKTVIVYYSMSGNCEMVAGKIAKRLDADLLRIEPDKAYPDTGAKKFIWGGKSAVMGEKPVLKPYTFEAGDYERIIFGFPVWASNPTPPIRTFIADNLDSIKDKKIAAFACQSGSGAEKAFAKLAKLLRIEELEDTLILIDPLNKAEADVDKRVLEFADKLSETEE